MVTKHPVYDSDTHFIIDPISRTMMNAGSTKSYIIQYDHNSERFTFELPRYIEEHDMSLCDVVQIHYINIGSGGARSRTDGVYEVADLQISPDNDEVVVFSWLISQNATQYEGTLNFLIRFACTDNGEIVYAWNTGIHKGITISSGIYNSDVVVEQYEDVLEQWRMNLQAFLLLDLKQTVISTEDEGVNVWTATFEDGTVRELQVRNGRIGPQGIQGPQGEVGPSGVYLGSDEPSEDYNVWIDPNGEGSVDLGDIDTALDSIIAIQESLIGGDSV